MRGAALCSVLSLGWGGGGVLVIIPAACTEQDGAQVDVCRYVRAVISSMNGFVPTEPSARMTKTFAEVQAFKRQLVKAETQVKAYAKATDGAIQAAYHHPSAPCMHASAHPPALHRCHARFSCHSQQRVQKVVLEPRCPSMHA